MSAAQSPSFEMARQSVSCLRDDLKKSLNRPFRFERWVVKAGAKPESPSLD